MASVSARKNRDNTLTWRVSFRIDGRQAQDSFDTQEAADSYKRLVERIGGDRARAVLESREGNSVGTPTLAEFTDRYLDPASGLLTGVEAGTRAGYRSIAARSFLLRLGEVPIDAIAKTDIGAWVSWQEKHRHGH